MSQLPPYYYPTLCKRTTIGFEPQTPWFEATYSNPLSYRPHPVSTGSVPESTPKKGKQYFIALQLQVQESSARSWNISSDYNVRIIKSRSILAGAERVARCTSFANEQASEYESKKVHFGFVANEYGWQVRRMAETEEEMREVAQIQAEAFHEPLPFFNDLFFQFFQAEVLAGLLYRLRNSPPHRYACLVAGPLPDTPGLEQELVGVVDVTAYRDDDVLMHLDGAEEYLYVSGIAVLNRFRRRKVATALLKACDMLALLWRFDYLVLKAYEDDWGARELYSNAGYTVVSRDPPWIIFTGRKRRVLMIKRSDQNL